jgi:hypothetical protein
MLVKSQRHGQSLSEYGFVMALVVIVAIAGVRMLGQNLNWKFGSMLPGPSTVAGNHGQQDGSQNGGSGSGSGSSAQGSGGQGNGSSKYSGPDGSDLNNATVEVAGGLGNQEQQQENGQQLDQSGQNKGKSSDTMDQPEGPSQSAVSESQETVDNTPSPEQQMQKYADQLMKIAAKLDPNSSLYHQIEQLSESGRQIGQRLTAYQTASGQPMEPSQDMMMRKGISFSTRDYSKILDGIYQNTTEYSKLSAKDKSLLGELAHASMSVPSNVLQGSQSSP